MLRLRPLLLTALAAAAIAPAAADAGITSGVKVFANYDFNGHLSSSYPRNLDLTQLGSGNGFGSTMASGQLVSHWHWATGNGLVAAAPSPSAWTVSATFRLDSDTGRKRVLGVQAATADAGFYLVDGKLVFDTGTTDLKKASPTQLVEGEFARLSFSRAADGTVKAFVNGAPELSFADTGGLLLATHGFRFFADDGAEEVGGDIRRLQVFDGTLDPFEVSILEPFDGTGAYVLTDGPPEFGGVRYVGRHIAFAGEVTDDGGMAITTESWLEKPGGDVVSPVSTAMGWPAFTPVLPKWNAVQYMHQSQSFSINAPAVQHGQPYRIAQRTIDNAGNIKAQDPIAVVGDTAAPNGLQITGVTVTDGYPRVTATSDPSPRESYATTVRICQGAACDDGGMYDGIGSASVYRSGGAVDVTIDDLSSGFEHHAIRLGEGLQYTAQVRNCDSAGNCEVADRTFTAPVAAPPVLPAAPAPQATQPLVRPAAPKAAVTPARTLLTAALKALRKGSPTVTFTAAVPGTATVKVLARGKVVAQGSRTFAKAGTGRVRLTPAKALRRRGLVARVTFTPKGRKGQTLSARVAK